MREEAKLIEGAYLYVWWLCEKCSTKELERKYWKKIDVYLK
jgi:hypothetical protein